MNSKDNYCHQGVIVGIDNGWIDVEIRPESACAGCHAKGICGSSESKTRIVRALPQAGFSIGERVNVVMTRSMGLKAVLLAYVIPLSILTILLLLLSSVIPSEVVVGGIVLAALAVYLLILFIFRDKTNSKFVFKVEKLQ